MDEFSKFYLDIILNDNFPLIYVLDALIPILLFFYFSLTEKKQASLIRVLGVGISLIHTTSLILIYFYFGITQGFGPSRWGSSSGWVMILMFLSLPIIICLPFFPLKRKSFNS